MNSATDQVPVRTHLAVDGMTCGHCVASVTEELSTLHGVHSVDVRLNAGGTSHVMVTSDAVLDPAAIRAAIDEAGYTLVEV
jgi:copper chaperone